MDTPSFSGHVMNKVLKVLDVLDQHNFDIVDSTYNMDSLYSKIFGIVNSKEAGEVGALQCFETHTTNNMFSLTAKRCKGSFLFFFKTFALRSFFLSSGTYWRGTCDQSIGGLGCKCATCWRSPLHRCGTIVG